MLMLPTEFAMPMKKLPLLAAALLLCVAGTASAQDDLRASLFQQADGAKAAADAANAQLLSPDNYERGQRAYVEADRDLARGRNLSRVRSKLVTASDNFAKAAAAAEIAKITLASVIKTRSDALAAKANSFASDLWTEAERDFNSAMTRLEAGDIKLARSRAASAEATFRDAELSAIKTQYLSQTRALLATAEKSRVQRYAPKTLAKAEALLARAEQELTENRYDTDLPRSLATEANYEARHAIYLAEHIREMRDQRLTLEDAILEYEEPLRRIAASADIVAYLDEGPEPVASELAELVEDMRDSNQRLTQEVDENNVRIAGLEEEIRELDEQLGGVSEERVALVKRLEAEARIKEQFERIETTFRRDEARVYRQGNDIIMRLVGLTFASGQSNVDPNYRPLLTKVRDAVEVFPRSQLVIEGHTDSYGGDESNMALSKRRAEAVGEYMVTQLNIPAYRISAAGFGETQPIANNETAEGRARNRRIDVVIKPQLD